MKADISDSELDGPELTPLGEIERVFFFPILSGTLIATSLDQRDDRIPVDVLSAPGAGIS